MGGVKTQQTSAPRGPPGGRAWAGRRHRRSEARPHPGGAQSHSWRRSAPAQQRDGGWGLGAGAHLARKQRSCWTHRQTDSTHSLLGLRPGVHPQLFRTMAGVCVGPCGAPAAAAPPGAVWDPGWPSPSCAGFSFQSPKLSAEKRPPEARIQPASGRHSSPHSLGTLLSAGPPHLTT